MAEIIGVTFKSGGKVYYFAPGDEEYRQGSGVIVETARGVEYATVVIPRGEIEDEKLVLPLKPVLRAATEEDDDNYRANREKKGEAMRIVREKVEKFNLEMKMIDCEFAFDNSKAVFYFTAPQRVDFRELAKELSSIFKMRIELRQLGIRDEIKMLGGLAPCGRECCCASCMPDIKKVSIKMAKNQGLSLNPNKISGLCGRLMCCLSYENDYYAEAYKQVPKLGNEIDTPEGKGTVVNVNMLKMQVRVKIEDKSKDLVTYRDFTIDELNGTAPPAAVEEEEPEGEILPGADFTEENGGDERAREGKKSHRKKKKLPRDTGKKPAFKPAAEGKNASVGAKGDGEGVSANGANAEKNDADKRKKRRKKAIAKPAPEGGDSAQKGAPREGRRRKFRKKPDAERV